MRKSSTMATATTEGKTTDANPPLCDACEDHIAIQYCLVCPGPLCDDCAKSHKKSKLTKDHSLCDLLLSRFGTSNTRSGEPPEGLSKCPLHGNKEMEHFCNDCICFICSDCKTKSDHGGHKIKLARDDISAHRTVYHDHLKRILDEAHDLEKYKINLEKMIKKYEDTCSTVDDKLADLITEITENAERLKKELRTVQGNLKELLGDAQTGLIKEMDSADTEITKLRDFRKTEDCGILSHALASSRCILDHLSDYKKQITLQTRTSHTINILPYENGIVSLKYYVRKYFVMEKSSISSMPKYSTLTQDKAIGLVNPKGSWGYRFCKPFVGEGLMIHGSETNDIRLYRDTYAKKMQIPCKIDVWNLVAMGHDVNIVLHKSRHELSILDDTFEVMETDKFNERVSAICYYRPFEFLMCYYTGDIAYFSIVSIKGKSFVKQRETKITGIPWPSYIESHPNKEHCLAARGPWLYKVSLLKSTLTKHDLSSSIERAIWSLCIDGYGNTLVGDAEGNIHKFDDKMNHEIVVRINSAVRDIFVKDNRLLVSSKDNKIYVYS